MYNLDTIAKKKTFYIVGDLVNVTISEHDKLKDGSYRPYLRGDATIVANFNNKLHTYRVELFKFKFKKGEEDRGEIIKSYSNFMAANNLIGKKVSVNGELSRSGFKTDGGEWAEALKLDANFINAATPSKHPEDKAEYLVQGFVSAELVEAIDKDGQPYRHVMQVMLPNYTREIAKPFVKPQVIELHVPMSEPEKALGVKNHCKLGTTVEIAGILDFETIEEEKTIEAAFGESTTRTYSTTRKNLNILGGKPLLAEAETYSQEAVKFLMECYEENKTAILNGSGSTSTKKAATSAAPKNSFPFGNGAFGK